MVTLPRVLVIDDLFGRTVAGVRNQERASLCGKLLLRDVTGDERDVTASQKIRSPIADAVFYRGQRPICSGLGDTVVNDLPGCLAKVRDGWQEDRGPTWSMVLVDLCFYTGKVTPVSDSQTPGMPAGRRGDDDPHRYFGIRILEALHLHHPDLPIVILSSKSRDEVSRTFSEKGALGFLPRDAVNGYQLLGDLLWRHGLFPDPDELIIGTSKPLLLALRSARRLALQPGNILLQGERGTGKELFAKYIHRCSDRAQNNRPFVPVNSAIFTPELFASDLFGIEPKTATGVAGKTGLIESADRGDLFLDEIKDMPHQVQAGLLRVLQERLVTRVGGQIGREVDVRFLSATNADLYALTEQDSFRPDLLDRLAAGGTLHLPGLKDRPSDIQLLVERFVREAEEANAGALRREVAADVVRAFENYRWPGNVRELRTVVFEAVNSHPDVEHLVLGHVRLPVARRDRLDEATIANSGRRQSALEPLARLIEDIARFEFDPGDPVPWAGRLSATRSACARLVARQLKASLLATRRTTLDYPQGELLIHPAAKLLTGEKDITASEAADLIKRLLNMSPPDKDDLLRDSVLREAFEIASRLRPTASSRHGTQHRRRT